MGKTTIGGDEAGQLSDAAKAAVRKYLVLLCAPPAIVLAIASAVAGYIINDWARGQAYADAYGRAITSIVDSAKEAAKAQQEAETASQSALAARTEVNITLNEVNASKDAIETVKQLADGKVVEIAVSLLQNPEFKNSLARVADDRVDAVLAEITNINARLATIATYRIVTSTQGDGPWDYSKVMCQDGYVLQGVRFQSYSGGSSGYLGNAAPVCAALSISP